VNAHLELLLSPVYSGALHPEHLADLRKSTLIDATIREQGIRSVPPGMIQHLLGFNPPGVTSAMLIPFPDPAGGWMDHIRMKIFPPQLSKKKGGEGETTIKYLQPKGSGGRLYFPKSTMRAVCESSETLRLVEGEKKALAVAQTGRPTVGFCGVEGWHAKGTEALLPDFDAIPLDGRSVFVIPDGDVKTNEMVQYAVERLGVALVARGARPELVHVPDAQEAAA
jgi:uncharacterized protein DUF3854